MLKLFEFKGSISSETINRKDKPLLICAPEKFEESDALKYYDDKRDISKFHKMVHDEPHMIRRKAILEKHPEIKRLYKKDSSSLFIVIGIFLIQFGMLQWITTTPWYIYWPCLYFISSTLNHALFVCMHDLTHYTVFESKFYNQLGAILSNIPQGVPSSIAFGRYHRDHHTYLGIPNWDPDLPTNKEIEFFVTPLRKILFVLMMPLFYSLRPYFVRAKKPVPMEIFNMIIVLITDYIVYRFYTIWGLFYLLLGTYFGLGFNPAAAHILAEHYEFVKGQETYSYYGPFNFIGLNIGYHIEHHDFPMISWRNLPKLRVIAPEFYNNLPHCDSYFQVWFRFFFDRSMGCWSRIGRIPLNGNNQKRN